MKSIRLLLSLALFGMLAACVTGGEAYFPGDLAVLGGTFEKVSDLIRSRYLIAYRPAGFSPDGKFRSIAITASKDGKQLRIRSRKGYHARLEQKTALQ